MSKEQPTQEEWLKMKENLKRKKLGATEPRKPYDPEKIKEHLRLVEEENNRKRALFEEQTFFKDKIWREKEVWELWRELTRFIKKVGAVGKNHENMVKISNLKEQPKEFLAGELIRSNPDDWERNPYFYTELHRVISEKFNPPKGEDPEPSLG